MDTEKTQTDFDTVGKNISEPSFENDPFKHPSNKISKPTIAGFLLIIAGLIAFISFLQLVIVDDLTIQSSYDIFKSQFSQFNINITQDQLKQSFIMCGTIGIIIAIFSILSGILSLKRKIWGFALVAGIPLAFIGLIIPSFSLFFISGILALIGILLIAFSRKEFQ